MTWKFEESVGLKSQRGLQFSKTQMIVRTKMACETITENSNIKEKNSTSHFEQKQHNKCFDKTC
jgi:hypothetical protein